MENFFIFVNFGPIQTKPGGWAAEADVEGEK
jgi:hypothetical protein